MKTKYYTSLIITLLVAGIALAMPIASVQAWGWSRPSITRFTVYNELGGMVEEMPLVTPLGMVGDRIFQKHEFRWENIATDARATVFNHNTLFWLWKEPMMNGVCWGSRDIRASACPTDPIIGHGYISGYVKEGVFTWKSVDYFDGYKIISQSSAPMQGLMDIHGIIIET
jgi:hypothetical protein